MRCHPTIRRSGAFRAVACRAGCITLALTILCPSAMILRNYEASSHPIAGEVQAHRQSVLCSDLQSGLIDLSNPSLIGGSSKIVVATSWRGNRVVAKRPRERLPADWLNLDEDEGEADGRRQEHSEGSEYDGEEDGEEDSEVADVNLLNGPLNLDAFLEVRLPLTMFKGLSSNQKQYMVRTFRQFDENDDNVVSPDEQLKMLTKMWVDDSSVAWAKEVANFRMYSHLGIFPHFYGSCNRTMVVDYLPGKDICSFPYRDEEKIKYALQALQIMQKIDENGLYYCDADFRHFLHDSEGNVKIVDLDSLYKKSTFDDEPGRSCYSNNDCRNIGVCHALCKEGQCQPLARHFNVQGACANVLLRCSVLDHVPAVQTLAEVCAFSESSEEVFVAAHQLITKLQKMMESFSDRVETHSQDT